MSTWGVFRGEADEKYICQIIKTPEEGNKYWMIKGAALKYGWDKVIPAKINRVGGWCKFEEKDDDFIRYIESDTEPTLSLDEKWPKNNPNFICGWVSPLGDTYGCVTYDHAEMAKDICNELYDGPDTIDEKGRRISHADDKLFESGWLKVFEKSFFGYTQKITKEQISKMDELKIPPRHVISDALKYRKVDGD